MQEATQALTLSHCVPPRGRLAVPHRPTPAGPSMGVESGVEIVRQEPRGPRARPPRCQGDTVCAGRRPRHDQANEGGGILGVWRRGGVSGRPAEDEYQGLHSEKEGRTRSTSASMPPQLAPCRRWEDGNQPVVTLIRIFAWSHLRNPFNRSLSGNSCCGISASYASAIGRPSGPSIHGQHGLARWERARSPLFATPRLQPSSSFLATHFLPFGH